MQTTSSIWVKSRSIVDRAIQAIGVMVEVGDSITSGRLRQRLLKLTSELDSIGELDRIFTHINAMIAADCAD